MWTPIGGYMGQVVRQVGAAVWVGSMPQGQEESLELGVEAAAEAGSKL